MTPTLLALTLVVAAPQLKEPPMASDSVVGRWVAQKIVIGGADSTNGNTDMEYEFNKDGTWIIYRNGKPLEGGRSFASNPKAKPAAVDLTENMRAMPGVFKIEGDTLTLSFHTGGGERPKGFEDPPDGLMTLTMSRIKTK